MKKNLLFLALIVVFIVAPGSVFCEWVDIDVSYISRSPRYWRYDVRYTYTNCRESNIYLYPGTETNKRWPDPGETVTYTGRVINRGESPLASFDYMWKVDGATVDSGAYTGNLLPGQETQFTYQMPWSGTRQEIQFLADTANSVTETVENNNTRTVRSDDLTMSIWVETGIYDLFNQRTNLRGSRSFEDWAIAQYEDLNDRFAAAIFPVSPAGVSTRLRIEKIVVANELNGAASPMNTDPDLYNIDGRWLYTDADPSNAAGLGGFYNSWVEANRNIVDNAILHETMHQLGEIDDYNMNFYNEPANNCRIQVQDINGVVFPYTAISPTGGDWMFPYAGVMGGGDRRPYPPGSLSSHDAGALNSNAGKRRGHYGDYLFDIPGNMYVKIYDSNGNTLEGATVMFFQDDPCTRYMDNTPEFSGITGADGVFAMPNRPAPHFTTGTGHVSRDNPFGQISVIGINSRLFVKVIKCGMESWFWITLIDANLAYWMGNHSEYTFAHQTNYACPFTPTFTPTNTPEETATFTPTGTPSFTTTVTLTCTATCTVTASTTPAITPTFTQTPEEIAAVFEGVFPNPAEDEALFVFRISAEADIELLIYTVSGEPIYSKAGIKAVKGYNTVLWDVITRNNKKASSGSYVFRLNLRSSRGADVIWGKLAVLR